MRSRTPHGEVDVAARKDRVLVIVEVKARRDNDTAIFAVTPKSQERIACAAQTLPGRWRLDAPIRFDIVVGRCGMVSQTSTRGLV